MDDSVSVGFDGVERDHVRPFLKGLGFRKRALAFTRVRGGLTDVVSLQRSSGNAGGNVRFYVNCGVYSAEFATTIGETVTERPREVDCQFRCRLESLASGAPPWFEITGEAPAEPIGSAVVAALDTAVRALGAIDTTDALADRISGGVVIEAFRYRVATEDWAAARAVYWSIRAEFGGEARWPRIDDNLRGHVPDAQRALVMSASYPG
ncbi:DUF4304 domain-containing protein [Prescottella agglutinans]|uniref:DUF4304 domain-containing protein n=1 Tax=Prescottella agglutinans TaxID=1644129 RepID=UPI0013E3CE73|nr:DUF4304 domain-containing protein [Prescottella agglutinans]